MLLLTGKRFIPLQEALEAEMGPPTGLEKFPEIDEVPASAGWEKLQPLQKALEFELRLLVGLKTLALWTLWKAGLGPDAGSE